MGQAHGETASSSSAPSRFDRSDVDLRHAHHCVESASRFFTAGGQRFGQHARGDLPGETPPVFAPPARALLTAIADDRVPVAVSLFLVLG